MAQIKDLTVYGTSKFLNKAYFSDADISGGLTVDGELHVAENLYLDTSSTSNGYTIYLNNKNAIQGMDDWLGININDDFTGINLGANIVRTYGTFQVGENGGSVNIDSDAATFQIPVNISKNVTVSNTLSATNAIFSDADIAQADIDTLYVKDTLTATRYEIATIQSLGGTFDICPSFTTSSVAKLTVSSSTSTYSLYKLSISGYYLVTITDENAITISSVYGMTWTAGSQVKVNGIINGVQCANVTGYLTYNLNSPKNTITILIPKANATLTTVSSGTVDASNIDIMLTHLYSSSTRYPVGIFMTSRDTKRNTSIAMYGGNTENPTVYLGNLSYTNLDSVGGYYPSGWGLYATNVFLNGTIVSASGNIGGWTIGSTALYNKTNSLTSTTVGTYIGTDGYLNYKSDDAYVKIQDGILTANGLNIASSVSRLETQVTEFSVSLDGITSVITQYGGVNLLLDSGNMKDVDRYVGQNSPDSKTYDEDTDSVHIVTTSTNMRGGVLINTYEKTWGSVTPEVGKTYTFSVELKGSSGNYSPRFTVYYTKTSGAYNESIIDTTYKMPSSFERMSWTFTIPDDFAKNLIIAICAGANDYYIRNPKLELGSVATAWTASPDDTTNLINEVKQTADANTASISSMQTVIDSKADGTTVTELTTRTSTLEQNLTGFKTEVSTTYATKTNVTDAINDISIGGKNLLLNTSDEWSDWYTPTANAANRSAFPFGSTGTCEFATVGQEVTFSADIEWSGFTTSSNGTFLITQVAYWANEDESSVAYSPAFKLVGSITEPPSDGIVHYSETTTLYIDRTDKTTVRPYLRFDYIGSGKFRVKNVKLEIGNKATDWTPSPDDLTSQIAKNTSLIQQNSESIALKVSADDIISTINQTAYDVTIQASKISLEGITTVGDHFKIDSETGVMTATNGSFSGTVYATDGSFSGTITAENGTIGGWTIGSTALYNKTDSLTSTTVGTYIGTDGIRQYASSSAYINMKNGVLTATGVNLTGTINASSGKIGSGSSVWTISGSAIYNGITSLTDTSHTGTYIGTNGIRNYKSATAYVTIQNGILTAKNANLSGTITATSGTFGNASISSSGLQIKSVGSSNDYYLELGGDNFSIALISTEGFEGGYSVTYDGVLTCKTIQADSSIFSYSTIKANSSITANENLYTGGYIYSNSTYSDDKAGIACQWADSSTHRLLARNANGLTAVLGWSGSSSYKTITNIVGQTVQCKGSTTWSSDANLKTDVSEFDSRYEDFFMKLNPVTYRYILGASHRLHSGYRTQDVEKALTQSNLTTRDFAGVVITPLTRDTETDMETGNTIDIENSESNYLLDKGINEQHNLAYTEFIALNTHMIQKNVKKIESLTEQIELLTAKVNKLQRELKQFK